MVVAEVEFGQIAVQAVITGALTILFYAASPFENGDAATRRHGEQLRLLHWRWANDASIRVTVFLVFFRNRRGQVCTGSLWYQVGTLWVVV